MQTCTVLCDVQGIQVEQIEYLTSIILSMVLLLWTATNADSNMDGNEDHMANADKALYNGYHDTRYVNIYPVLT
jgi:hypothetical protein